MKTPCKNCKLRSLACHCICPEYKRYKQELEEKREYIRKYTEEYQAQQRPVLKKI